MPASTVAYTLSNVTVRSQATPALSATLENCIRRPYGRRQISSPGMYKRLLYVSAFLLFLAMLAAWTMPNNVGLFAAYYIVRDAIWLTALGLPTLCHRPLAALAAARFRLDDAGLAAWVVVPTIFGSVAAAAVLALLLLFYDSPPFTFWTAQRVGVAITAQAPRFEYASCPAHRLHCHLRRSRRRQIPTSSLRWHRAMASTGSVPALGPLSPLTRSSSRSATVPIRMALPRVFSHPGRRAHAGRPRRGPLSAGGPSPTPLW